MQQTPRSSIRRTLCLFLAVLGSATVAPAAIANDRGSVHLLVKFETQAAPRQLRALGATPAGRLPQLHVQVLRVPRSRLAVVMSRLQNLPGVRYAERNRVVMQITSKNAVQAPPSDPLWPQQWGAALADAPTAWAVTKGSPSIVVAVLDTGVDPTQPDLQGALVPGYDFVNNDADPNDDHGHGTEIAGIVAARSDNGIGGSGYCPRCSIMPVKVVGADGMATELNVASGITWAADHGARVINLSLGGTFGATVASAVDYATSKGSLVVAAAGNNGNSTPFYPAADNGVVSVAATQQNDQLYSWSNYGSWVAVAAPGCALTTLRGAEYGDACGTSASTPAVSGLAGLAMSYAPGAALATIKQAITSRAHPVASVTYGRIDVAGTLAALGATFATAPTAAPASPVAVPEPVGATKRRGAPQASRKRARFGPQAARVERGWLLRKLRVEPFGRRG